MTDKNTYHHIENITKKKLESVELKSFKNDDKTFYNLTFKTRSDNGCCSNTIVLTEEQKNKLKIMMNEHGL